MPKYCDACQPQQVVASKKMLVLSSDPSVTVWVCDAHAQVYGLDETNIIGDEEMIEELWAIEASHRDGVADEDEEDPRESNFDFVTDEHSHYCSNCDQYYDCDDDECVEPLQRDCSSCIAHENINYSQGSN